MNIRDTSQCLDLVHSKNRNWARSDHSVHCISIYIWIFCYLRVTGHFLPYTNSASSVQLCPAISRQTPFVLVCPLCILWSQILMNKCKWCLIAVVHAYNMIQSKGYANTLVRIEILSTCQNFKTHLHICHLKFCNWDKLSNPAVYWYDSAECLRIRKYVIAYYKFAVTHLFVSE